MARERTNESAAAKSRVREGLVAAVATVIRAGDAVTAATARPRTAIQNLFSGARTRVAERARPRRARQAAATGGAPERQAVTVTSRTSPRALTHPPKRSKSAAQRKQSRRRTPRRRRP